KAYLSDIMILLTTRRSFDLETFQNAIDVTTAEPAIRKGKIGIELNSSLKMFDCGIDVCASNGVINELAHAIAPSQILLRSRRVRGANLCQLHLLRRTQHQPQPF